MPRRTTNRSKSRKFSVSDTDIEWLVPPVPDVGPPTEQQPIVYLLTRVQSVNDLDACLPNVTAYLADHEDDTRVIELLQLASARVGRA